MKKFTFFLLAAIFAASTLKASEKTDNSKIYFENAFSELKSMLEGKTPLSFERAVFVSENPYWNNKYSYEAFRKIISGHLYFVENIISANNHSDTMNFSAHVMSNGKFKMDDIRYLPKEKKELYLNALKNWAIFTYITDTTVIAPFYHLPISYASNDPFGRKNWGNSQVLNLLASKEQKGNCYALAAFFKILSDRLNAGAIICTAPQHIYIEHKDKKGDKYNVELATAGHPGDGIIQTLTYTTNEAIMSGIALREYNEKENIGLCLVNLAKSYEHKFNSKGDEFILRCAELTLKHDSLNLNALLLKQQVLDERVTSYALKKKINNIARLKTDKEISGTYSRLQKHLSKLYTLGYRQMPLYMQQMILDGFSDEKTGSILAAKNPSPFTTIKVDPKDEQYWTLSHGAFQEVFVPKKFELYGHFTINTDAKTISAIDTTEQKGFLIDPVAFAYDFGARMYDARLGIFTSVDPMAHKHPGWSPYVAFNANPIYYIDPDGKEGIGAVDHTNKTITIKAVYFTEIGKSGFNAENYKQLQGLNATLNTQKYQVTDEQNTLHGYTVQFDLQFVPAPTAEKAQQFAVSEQALTSSNSTGGVNLIEGGFNIGNSLILTDNPTFEAIPSIKETAAENNVGPEKVLGITDVSLQHINIPEKSRGNALTALHEIFHTLYTDKDKATSGIGTGKVLPNQSDVNDLIKNIQGQGRVVEEKK